MDRKMEFNARERLKLVLGGSGVLLSACSGGGSSGTGSTSFGSTPTPTPITPTPTPTPVTPTPTPTTSLKGFYQNNFKVGGALAGNRTNPLDASASLALEHFSSITPEYELKADALAPTQGVYDFDPADRIVDWALNNGMDVRGHSLLWHEGTPDYFLTGSRDDIRAKLEDYINAVMTHFKGRITTWDVVNEVVSVDLYNGDAGIGPDRRTPWFDAVGNADYLDWAFIAARAADPDAVLFLNDYQTEEPRKQAWLIDILNRFESRGVPIDGVGHQFHFQLDTDPNDALGAIDAVDNLFRGLINHVTELDMSFYQDPGSCWETGTACQADIGPVASDALLATQAQAFKDLFDGLTLRSSVESVSFWGVRDSDSWLNNAPAVRYNYPLLFGRDGDPKPAFYALTDPSYQI